MSSTSAICVDVTSTTLASIVIPGQIKNTDCAVSALGGLTSIDHAVGHYAMQSIASDNIPTAHDITMSDGESLQLKLRPDDEQSIPLASRIDTSYSAVVLKFHKRAGKIVDITYAGRVTRQANFPYMADFQVLCREGEMHCVPPVMASEVQVRDFKYGNATMLKAARQRKEYRKRAHIERWSRFKPTDSSVDVVPNTPPSGSFSASDEASNHAVTISLRAMFDVRPIYSKLAVLFNTQHLDRRSVLRFLPSVAYKFSSGAFRNVWISYGYDPRRHQDSMHYQIIEVRLKEDEARAIGLNEIKAERYRLSANTFRTSSSSLSSSNQSDGPDPSHPDVKLIVMKSDVDVSAPAPRRIHLYQIIDIAGTEFAELRAHVKPTRVYAKNTGWWSQQDLAQLRSLLRQRVEVWLRQSMMRRDGRSMDSSSVFRLVAQNTDEVERAIRATVPSSSSSSSSEVIKMVKKEAETIMSNMRDMESGSEYEIFDDTDKDDD